MQIEVHLSADVSERAQRQQLHPAAVSEREAWGWGGGSRKGFILTNQQSIANSTQTTFSNWKEHVFLKKKCLSKTSYATKWEWPG